VFKVVWSDSLVLLANIIIDSTVVGRLANYKYFNMYQSILNALEPFDSNAPKAAVFQVFKLDSGGPD
ncbi:MAG: hypothetical protein ACI90V_002447, partial [Bacillariaceae sp.]